MKSRSNDSTGDSIEAALALLKQEGRACRRRLWLCIGCAGTALILFIIAVGRSNYDDTGGLLLLLLPLGLIVLGAVAIPRSRSRALEGLEARKDVRMIEPLLDVLAVADGERRKAVLALLTDLLPHADAGILDTAQRRRLYREMIVSDCEQEADFLAAIVRALERIGDIRALPYVEHLALRGGEPRVQEAAESCLIVLRARIERERPGRDLLRAAAPAGPDELLRPARHTHAADAGQLLRTGLPEEEPFRSGQE